MSNAKQNRIGAADAGRMSVVIAAATSGTIAGTAIARELVTEDAEAVTTLRSA